MNSKPQTKQPPRPLRRNPWPALLAGAAVVVLAGNVACKPVPVDDGNILGSYIESPGIEWVDPANYDAWEQLTQPYWE
jgi:hypothetical protein